MLVDSNSDVSAHPKLDGCQSHPDRAAQLRGRHALSRLGVETLCSINDLDEIAIVAVCLSRSPGQNSLRPAWLTCDLDNTCGVGHGRRTLRAGRFAAAKRVVQLTKSA